jgi:hypothetical protein
MLPMNNHYALLVLAHTGHRRCHSTEHRKARMSKQAQIAAGLERIKYLTEALARASPASAQHRALAEELHWESARYLALVDAHRGVDRKDDDQT